MKVSQLKSDIDAGLATQLNSPTSHLPVTVRQPQDRVPQPLYNPYATSPRRRSDVVPNCSSSSPAEKWVISETEIELSEPSPREVHLRYLRSEHARLKKSLLVKADSQLINEQWYGSIESKYRMTFVDPTSIPMVSRMSELNYFILDGELPNGDTIRFPSSMAGVHRPEHLAKHYIREVCDSARKIVQNQYFQDGNHRTATLSIYEALADVNVLLTCAPMKIYIALSNRKELPEHESKEQLFNLVWKNHHKSTNRVTSMQRGQQALAVKKIHFYNTQVENVWTVLLQQKDLMKGRELLRQCKRTDRATYNSLIALKGVELWS